MRRLSILSAAVLSACYDRAVDRVPPMDGFYFPESLAVRHLGAAGQDCTGGDAGCTTQLLAVSTNFDLRYDSRRGGTLLSVAVPPDPFPAPPDADLPLLHPILDVRGAVRIGSLGGTLALLEDRFTLAAQVLGGDERYCRGWSTAADPAFTPQALVASRVTRELHRVGLRGDLGLDCADGCAASLDDPATAADDRYHDPYGIGLACRGTGTAYRAYAFVTFLTTPLNEGVLAEFDLGAGQLLPAVAAGADAAHTAAYDAAADRLFFTGRFSGTGFVPFRYLDVGRPSGDDVRVADLSSQLRGAETRGFALSSDRQRAYVALRLYDADLADRTLARPPDVGGALGVLDLAPDPYGNPAIRVITAVPVGRSPSEVAVIPRPGRRDLVAVSCPGDDTLWLYDDEAGAVAKTFAVGAGGPLLGKEPSALAVERRAGGRFRLYVASFSGHLVTAVDVDPAAPGQAKRYMVLGGPRP